MYTVQSIVIERPRDEVFAFAADVTNFGKWLHKTIISEACTTPNVVGTTWQQESWSGGIRFKFWNSVTAYAPPEFFAYRAMTNVTTNLVELRFTDMGTRTRVDTEWRMEGRTWYLKLLFACIAQQRFANRMAFESKRHLAGLKAAMEQPALLAQPE